MIPNYTLAQKTQNNKSSFSIHFAPLSLFEFNPRLRVGSILYNNLKSYGIELGYGNGSISKMSILPESWSKEYQFFEARTFINFPFLTKCSDASYLKTELIYARLKDKRTDGRFVKENSRKLTYFDEAVFQKMKTGLIISFGYRSFLTDHLYLDVTIGPGIVFRKSRYDDIINPIESDESIRESFFNADGRKETGNKIVFHPSFGIFFGYLIK